MYELGILWSKGVKFSQSRTGIKIVADCIKWRFQRKEAQYLSCNHTSLISYNDPIAATADHTPALTPIYRLRYPTPKLYQVTNLFWFLSQRKTANTDVPKAIETGEHNIPTHGSYGEKNTVGFRDVHSTS
jgi:hypothetical protein